MFIGIARLLWAFNITPAKDAIGNAILPDAMDSVDEGLVVRPTKFPCTITPRSIDVESVVAHTMELRRITS
ncbi:hypothetical protein M413DRAFT_286074 [Hebeloma cylindrosporum]|uniref:Uncharacterized protein n=1 Tax=Hebeloma cylindrosporum TaxID=76867 RepID=A0A0C3BX82_HEBCY|nr:hypothetical protein M413DRAFT_286074 [Hebeloma cylindrosporum h7]